MISLLVILGSLIAASGTVPYILATIRRQTKPRIVTWLTWALLTGLAAVAAFSDHKVGAGLFALLGALSCTAVVASGLRYGDRSFARLDSVCLGGVVAGLVLWLFFNNPAIGVWAAIVIDFIGLVPTIKHSWDAPHEETPITYLLVGIGGALTVVAVCITHVVSVTSVGYPLYAGASLGLLAVLIVTRRRFLATQSHAIVGVWEWHAPDAPFPWHVVTFTPYGTMGQSNPHEGNRGESDSSGHGIWRAGRTPDGKAGIEGKFVEYKADRRTGKYVGKGVIEFSLVVTGDLTEGTSAAYRYDADGALVRGPLASAIHGTRVVFDEHVHTRKHKE